MILPQEVDCSQTLQIFDVLLQIADLCKSQMGKNQIDEDLIVPLPTGSDKFY